jgi:hypothetical protein
MMRRNRTGNKGVGSGSWFVGGKPKELWQFGTISGSFL